MNQVLNTDYINRFNDGLPFFTNLSIPSKSINLSVSESYHFIVVRTCEQVRLQWGAARGAHF